ncbi:MAG: RNA polymerase sigma factor [Deltaproteobacteria bacterium]|nr:RNA polymerase sigma factor [Deltaproteobacteria bacterium]
MGDVVQLLQRQPGEEGPISDALLLAALANGDGNALAELYLRHHLKVYRFLARMAPLDQSHLDDMVQNTFLAVRQGAHRFKGNASVQSWLLAVAANILKQHIRKESRRRAIAAALTEIPLETTTDETPEARLARQNSMRLLGKRLHGMSHKLKTVFIMCDLEGISGSEVAAVLNLRQGTVWRRLHDARKQLRVALAEYMEVDT